jgi:hypothetical protein
MSSNGWEKGSYPLVLSLIKPACNGLAALNVVIALESLCYACTSNRLERKKKRQWQP